MFVYGFIIGSTLGTRSSMNVKFWAHKKLLLQGEKCISNQWVEVSEIAEAERWVVFWWRRKHNEEDENKFDSLDIINIFLAFLLLIYIDASPATCSACLPDIEEIHLSLFRYDTAFVKKDVHWAIISCYGSS